MTERYAVTLHSPMGPRNGTLLLTFSGNQVTGSLSLLGYDNPVSGMRTADGILRLSHLLHSDMRDITCESEFHLTGETLTGTTHTGQGSMFWNGTRVSCPTEKKGTD